MGQPFPARAWGVEHLTPRERMLKVLDAGVRPVRRRGDPRARWSTSSSGRRERGAPRRLGTPPAAREVRARPLRPPARRRRGRRAHRRRRRVPCGRRGGAACLDHAAVEHRASGCRRRRRADPPARPRTAPLRRGHRRPRSRRRTARSSRRPPRPTSRSSACRRRTSSAPRCSRTSSTRARSTSPTRRSRTCARSRHPCPPWSTCSSTGPAILTPFAGAAAAIVANYGASAEPCSTCSLGDARPEGWLPFDLPSSMAAVEANRARRAVRHGRPAVPVRARPALRGLTAT